MSDVGGFDLFEDAVVAHRQMFNAANERLRTQLLTALGLSDDGKTSLTEYVAQLIAERDAMRPVVEAAIERAMTDVSPPRIWAMPEIPPDVTTVRDAAGTLWNRSIYGWTSDVDFGSTGWLIVSHGPLTEVMEVAHDA